MLPFLHRAATETMDQNPLWLVVLCDIMTNLMLFFLILYAFTRQPEENRRKFVEGLTSTLDTARMKEQRAEKIVQNFKEDEASRALQAAFRDPTLKESTEVQVTEKQIRVRLDAPVLFESGQATLSPRAQKVLRPVGRLLAGLKDRAVIEGHTDNIPISRSPYRTNWELSIARAYAVVGYFSQTLRIPENRFVIAGYGEYRPVGDNRTLGGRAKNRRIEIVFMRGSPQ